MSSSDPPENPRGDVSISLERANAIALGLLPAIAAVGLLPLGLAHGWGEIADGLGDVLLTLWFLPAFLAAVVAHEGLHALGFLLFGRVPRAALHFGLHRATLSPFAGCRAAVTARAYRASVALPAIVLGLAPWIAGLATGRGWLAVWGVVMAITASGDLIVLWTLRGLPGGTRVLDHPERVGCRIL